MQIHKLGETIYTILRTHLLRSFNTNSSSATATKSSATELTDNPIGVLESKLERNGIR
jgi:hypothetical protein